ncbi:hypothetical protein BHM03_00044855 [Ensete ventricosum]|nr:hypothetical protein BHM03_00044855 [Ensete ventricosum]
MKLGAFYPFARDHSDIHSIHQELYIWDSVARSARKALGLRYRLLPHIYTLMYEAHVRGAPIARPLFFSFPEDTTTYGISTQFLMGAGVMVSPVLKQNAVTVDAYFPKGRWYNLFDYLQWVSSKNGEYVTLDAPADTINVHVRGGNIVVMQGQALTTRRARQNPFELLVALDEAGSASGEVFVDDGEEVEMGGAGSEWSLVRFRNWMEGKKILRLNSQVVNGTYALKHELVIRKVVIVGLHLKPTSHLNATGLGGNVSIDRQIRDGSSVVQIEGFSQLMGKEFGLKLEINE